MWQAYSAPPPTAQDKIAALRDPRLKTFCNAIIDTLQYITSYSPAQPHSSVEAEIQFEYDKAEKVFDSVNAIDELLEDVSGDRRDRKPTAAVRSKIAALRSPELKQLCNALLPELSAGGATSLAIFGHVATIDKGIAKKFEDSWYAVCYGNNDYDSQSQLEGDTATQEAPASANPLAMESQSDASAAAPASSSAASSAAAPAQSSAAAAALPARGPRMWEFFGMRPPSAASSSSASASSSSTLAPTRDVSAPMLRQGSHPKRTVEYYSIDSDDDEDPDVQIPDPNKRHKSEAAETVQTWAQHMKTFKPDAPPRE
jgi:hypothetical protein